MQMFKVSITKESAELMLHHLKINEQQLERQYKGSHFYFDDVETDEEEAAAEAKVEKIKEDLRNVRNQINEIESQLAEEENPEAKYDYPAQDDLGLSPEFMMD